MADEPVAKRARTEADDGEAAAARTAAGAMSPEAVEPSSLPPALKSGVTADSQVGN